MPDGDKAVAKSVLGPKVPLPLPKRTLTLLDKLLAVMMSSLPSPFTSPKETERGFCPVAKSALGPKVPLPLPKSTLAVLAI